MAGKPCYADVSDSQLISSSAHIVAAGFFHADPHPGNNYRGYTLLQLQWAFTSLMYLLALGDVLLRWLFYGLQLLDFYDTCNTVDCCR